MTPFNTNMFKYMLNLNAWIFKDKKNFLSLAGHTWVDAGATTSTAVVLFSHNYFPPDRERKITNINVKKNLEKPTGSRM